MAISFGGLSSGLPVNDIISGLIDLERQPIRQLQTRVQEVNQEISIFNAIESEVTQLETSLERLTADSFLDTDLFNARNVSSSNEDIVTATAGEGATLQNLNVEVVSLATSTQAQSVNQLGAGPTETALLSSIPRTSFTTGDFTLYVDNQAHTISVNADTETLGDVFARIESIAGVSDVSVDAEGRFSVTATGNLTFGGNGDTSNFLATTRLDTSTQAGGVYTGSSVLSMVDLDQDVSSAAAGLSTAVTAGSTFRIGNATFDTTGKSLGQLINEINENTDADVTASYNSAEGTLQVTSNSTGAVGINFEDVSGNFLNAVGLVNGTDSLSSQTLGTNAEVNINGSAYFSTSNTLDQTVTGFNELSINLQSATPGTTVELTVGRDTAQLTEALEGFISEFNDVINRIDEVTDSETGILGPDNRLRGFRNSIRSTVSGFVSGLNPGFGSLQSVGISTGAVGASSGGQAPTNLQLDSSALVEALQNNPTDLKELMVGNNGVLRNLLTQVSNAVDTGDGTNGSQGLFATQETSAQSQITRLNRSITSMEERLIRREESLRRQFQASENLISQFQAQGQALAGLAAAPQG